MAMYHTNGPVGGYTIGFIAAGVAVVLWGCVYLYFFVFFKRKERAATKLRQQMRFAPASPRKAGAKKKQSGA